MSAVVSGRSGSTAARPPAGAEVPATRGLPAVVRPAVPLPAVPQPPVPPPVGRPTASRTLPSPRRPSGVSRSAVRTRAARPDDLPAVLALVRQHQAESRAEQVLTGQVAGPAAAAGFRRLLVDPSHSVVLAVLPGGNAPGVDGAGEVPVGLAVLGVDPLSVVLGAPQVTIDSFVVHRDHRRRGVGAVLLAAAAEHAAETGAQHVVAAAGGHEAERQRFFARMGFAPLTTRRIVSREQLGRSLAAWQQNWVAGTGQRRPGFRRRAPLRPLPDLGPTSAEDQASS